MGASEDIISAGNVLRDLIEAVLGAALGPDWLEQSGLTAERLDRMRGRLAAETASRPGGAVEQRLIYYSDLPDLKTIIDKNWERFKPCLGEKKACDVNLDRLADFRIAEMHGRQLLPFELALTAGISGEIRNRVAIFRSERGPAREYFPRIEYVRDSFGNVRHGHGSAPEGSATRLILHPGDEITFDCRAWDPDNLPFTWSVLRSSGEGCSMLPPRLSSSGASWPTTLPTHAHFISTSRALVPITATPHMTTASASPIPSCRAVESRRARRTSAHLNQMHGMPSNYGRPSDQVIFRHAVAGPAPVAGLPNRAASRLDLGSGWTSTLSSLRR